MESQKHKLVATLECYASPLEKTFFEGTKVIEFFVSDPHDAEEVLQTLEPLVMEIRGDDQTALLLHVTKDNGDTVLRGTIKNGFSGISIM